jgi:hypothetical protein
MSQMIVQRVRKYGADKFWPSTTAWIHIHYYDKFETQGHIKIDGSTYKFGGVFCGKSMAAAKDHLVEFQEILGTQYQVFLDRIAEVSA